MSYQQIVTEDRRLVILKILQESDHYSTNEHLLRSVLHSFGHNIGRDKLRTELSWLQEQNLVSVDTVSDVQIAKLTGRGIDVATGSSVVPGVKRPEPE